MLYMNEDLVASTVRGMTLDTPDLNPFGLRFDLDRRYKVWAIAAHGNGHHETIYGHVGGIQFELYIVYETREVTCKALKRSEYFRNY